MVILISKTANGFVATVSKSHQQAMETRIEDMHCFQALDVGPGCWREDKTLFAWLAEQLNPQPAPPA